MSLWKSATCAQLCDLSHRHITPSQARQEPAPASGATGDMVVSAPRRSAGPSAAASANGGGQGPGGGGGSGGWGGSAFGARWSPATGDLYNPFGDNPLQRAFAGNYKCVCGLQVLTVILLQVQIALRISTLAAHEHEQIRLCFAHAQVSAKVHRYQA